jgi:hypothetical protein
MISNSLGAMPRRAADYVGDSANAWATGGSDVIVDLP